MIDEKHDALLSEMDGRINGLQTRLEEAQTKAYQESLRAAGSGKKVKELEEKIGFMGKCSA